MALAERRSSTSAPERWRGTNEVDQATDRMRQLLDETFGTLPTLLLEPAAWSPPVDIEETDDAYVIEAEVPGVHREDVNIEMVGNELSITGELKEKERVGILRRRTRKTGRFEYRVVLPAEVDASQVDAHLDGGLLKVRVPKAQRAQRRRIEVKS